MTSGSKLSLVRPACAGPTGAANACKPGRPHQKEVEEVYTSAQRVTEMQMYIDDKLEDGYVIVCGGDGDPHSFLVRNLSLSVQCPQCGKVSLSGELATEFFSRYYGDQTAAQLEKRTA